MKKGKNIACTEIDAKTARELLVGHHGLNRIVHPKGAAGAISLLKQLGCIQLDPLDVLGTNADLVGLARVDGLKRGDLFRMLYPGHAFEHFAKERCLLPAHHFPWYQSQAAATPWWRLSERKRKISPTVLKKVLAEVRERGPVTVKELTDHGKVEAIDWNGWKGTSSATAMALEVLWTQCKVVVCGRGKGGKRYDVPERALAKHLVKPQGDFHRWAVLQRVESAGLLSRNSGPHWSMLATVRLSTLPDQLVEEGLLQEIRIAGSPRRYLAPFDWLDRRHAPLDNRMRLLGPLDSLIWDRDLVRSAFGFVYVWEVYKPAADRKWGWYVCPLLHRGQLVGRLQGSVQGDSLQISNIWKEPNRTFDRSALKKMLHRHALACGAERVVLSRSAARGKI